MMKLMKRMLSMLLVALMILSVIPGGIFDSTEAQAAQTVTAPTTLKIDFKETAMKVAQQSWWKDMRIGSNDTTRSVGCVVYNTAMTATQQQAYDSLRAWLQENENWNINETNSILSAGYNVKAVFFNADPNVPWGICYRPYFHSMDKRSSLYLDMTVPEGGAGLYRLEMDIFRETTNYVSSIGSIAPGGGYADIYVNGELVYDEYCFTGPNRRAVENLGTVYLNEGVNTIQIDSTRGLNGTTSSNERCVYDLCGMTFERLGELQVEQMQKAVYDLRTSYLPYDANIDSTYALVVEHEGAVGASFDADGNLVLLGKTVADTEVVVKKDGNVLCTIPVSVVPKTSMTYDFQKASALTVNGFDVITKYEDMDIDDGVLSDLWKFKALEADGAYWSESDAVAVLESGRVSFTVNVEEDSWYRVSLDAFGHTAGGDAAVYLDDLYLGTCDTLADAKSLKNFSLRPLELEAGEHTLTLQTEKGTTLWWNVLRMKQIEEPALTLSAESLFGKQGRHLSSEISAVWDYGRVEELHDAVWNVSVDKAGVAAHIEGSTLYVTGEKTGEYVVTVSAELCGVTGSMDVPVTIVEKSPLASAIVELPFVAEQQIARNTVHAFEYTLIAEDGDTMYPYEVDIDYAVDEEGIVTIDEEAHTVTGLSNGQVEITVTVTDGDVTETKVFPLTVANTGGNLLDTVSANFEAEEWTSENWDYDQPWNSSERDDAAVRFVNTDVVEEEDGNHVMRFTFNPESTYNTKSSGAKLQTVGGRMLELQPGRLYEASVLVKTEDVSFPEGTNVMLLYQSYDFPSNKASTVLNELYDSVTIPQQSQWTRITVPIRAPIDHEGPIYYMSCFVIRPSSSIYHDTYGFSGCVYVDDIQVREVGFDRVEVSVDKTLTDNRSTATVYAEPYTTNDQVIALDAGRFDLVEVENSNPDVLVIDDELVLKASTSGESVPSMTVSLTGLNGEAQLSTSITIHGVTQTGTLDMSQNALADEMLHAYYTVNGLDGVTLSVGGTAEGDLSGLTTQNISKTEAELREQGSVYFKSSNEAVVTVDQLSGDVTAVGEGTATVTAYANFGGFVKKDEVTVVVTDDTELASVSVTYNRDHIGTSHQAVMIVSGTKSSGVVADMSLYPITWSVDNEELAVIDGDGRLTAKAVGTVTVTATANVDGREVAGSFTMTIVDNTDLPGDNYEYVLHHGQYLVLLEGSLEEDGIALNKELTDVDSGMQWNSAHGLVVSPFYPGHQVALDFILPKSGWYTLHNIGTSFSWGGLVDVFLDDRYMGQSDYATEFSSYGTGPALNTVYLEAGKHTLLMINVRSGYMWCGGFKLVAADDFGEPAPVLQTKQTLLVGETAAIAVDFMENNGATFYLKQIEEGTAAGHTNVYSLSSSNEDIVAIDNGMLIAKAPGKATITMIAEVDHEQIVCEVEIAVLQGRFLSAGLNAEYTTVRPDAEPIQLTLTAYGVDGAELEVDPELVTYESKSSDVATVDQNGLVTLKGIEGSTEIVATIREGENVLTANIWITTTNGKSQPTLYTWEEREIIRENVLKYSWAWQQKEAVVPMADFVVENLDLYYDRITHEGLKRNVRIAGTNDPEGTVCYNCKTELAAIYNHYPWEIDPINDPWKIKCPLCHARFPSNDFASFYECGLDEQGRFSKERALANGGEKYLVNELYPEMGPDYGVDDGDGWVTGRYFANGVKEVRYFVAYYHLAQYWPLGTVGTEYAMLNAMEDLRDAYLYTGDEKYAIAGTILLDRFADVYPDFHFFTNSISRDRGKIVDMIWEGLGYQQMFATCADVFWPVMDHPDVVEYLRGRHVKKGVEDPADITPEYIRDHIDNNILLEIKRAVEGGQSKGNSGMTEAAMAYAAVALDRLPESEEMIDWIFRSGEFSILNSSTGSAQWTGGSVMDTMVQRVNRDGLGDEGSIAYNRMWYQNFIKIADALSGYERVEGADLWKNSKFLDMFIAMNKVTVLGNSVITTGETGYMQASAYYPQTDYLLQMFVNTADDQVAHIQAAQIIYAANGHSVDGLHGDIYTKDPEQGLRTKIQKIVNEHGEWDASASDMLCGEGLAILRNGPSKLVKGSNDDKFSDYWMFFGLNGSGHGAWEALSIGIDAYGLSFTGGTGYPVVVNSGSAPREHFMRATLSHNTVTVNEKSQLNIKKNSFPMHFDDAGKVKVIDAEAAQAYRETEIYRRTLVTVEMENEEYYAVDFFRVLGGSDHVYSFHVHGQSVNETKGLNLTHQPMGTYAGADVPLGIWSPNPYVGDTASNREPYGDNTAASWMDNVYRDSAPSGNFTVDFGIKDFHGRLNTTKGLGLRFTMLSDEPLTEVAIADGHPDQNGYNPEYVKYLLVNHNTGRNDLNTMFTSVIEPYQFEYKLEGSELVCMDLVDGAEVLNDECAAIKVTRKDGQVDYIVYATNNACTYMIDGLFEFKGFVGVCSYRDGKLIYAYGNDAEKVADVIEDRLPAITGEVVSFTEGLAETYEMTVRVDQPVTEADFDGRYIYVNNDRAENGAYRIYGAKVNGDIVVLDLFTQSIARSFVDGKNMDLGYIHNIEVGQTFTIPLSATFDALDCFHYTTDTVVRAGNKLALVTGVTGRGITYAADGLVAGMKFDAKSGALDWSTSRTQTGRYPITVKALMDGEVVSEMAFVIYVVNYTGSVYEASVCAHGKTVTFTVNGVLETVCPACGTITKTDAPVGKFAFVGSNMTLGNELKVNFMVNTTDLKEGYKGLITHDGKTVEAAFTKYNGTYSMVSYSVCAKQMADTISVVVVDASGNAVSEVYVSSVRDYAMKALTATTSTAKVKTMVVNMLNYGAAAQKYFDYDTSDLATDRLTNVQMSWATGDVECTDSRVKGKNYYGSNLSLEDKIVLNLYFKNCTDTMTAKVTYTDYMGKAHTVAADLVQYSGSIYKVVVDEIVLADAFSLVTVTVYDGETVSATATDSVESYVARAEKSELYDTIIKFAASAKAYFA